MGVDCFLRSAGLPLTSGTAGTDMSSADCVGEVSGDSSGVWVEGVVVAGCLAGVTSVTGNTERAEGNAPGRSKVAFRRMPFAAMLKCAEGDKRGAGAGGVKGVVRRRCSPGARSVGLRGSVWQRRSRELN
jgi:hypothetical protein